MTSLCSAWLARGERPLGDQRGQCVHRRLVLFNRHLDRLDPLHLDAATAMVRPEIIIHSRTW